MGCFESKNNKNKAKPFKFNKVVQGQFNLRWRRLLLTSNASGFLIDDCNGVAQHPAFRAIEKDIQRTFPNHQFFQKKQNLVVFQETLKCFALTFPKVGYTQGLNFITGYFLINKSNKLQCLNLLVGLCTHPSLLCLGLYEDGFPLAHFYCELFWKILQKIDLKFYQYLKSIDMPDYMWIFQWYLTFFLYSFPLEYISYYLNYILEEKQFSMVKLSLGIVLCLKEDILNLQEKDDVGFAQFLQNLKDVSICMKMISVQTSLQKSQQISNELIEKCLKQIKNQGQLKNFYINYFSLFPKQRRVLYDIFISGIKQNNTQLSNSKHDNDLMQSYKRNRENVQILDEILIQSIKRQKCKQYKSNMVNMGESKSRRTVGFRKWKSLAQLEQQKMEGQTTVSIVKRMPIPQDKDE